MYWEVKMRKSLLVFLLAAFASVGLTGHALGADIKAKKKARDAMAEKQKAEREKAWTNMGVQIGAGAASAAAGAKGTSPAGKAGAAAAAQAAKSAAPAANKAAGASRTTDAAEAAKKVKSIKQKLQKQKP